MKRIRGLIYKMHIRSDLMSKMRNKLRFIKGIVHQNEHSIIIYSLSYIVKSV